MKYPEQTIRRELTVTPAIARHVGFRIYPMIVPNSTSMPFITYQRNGVTREQAINAPPGVPRVDLELNVFADTYATTRELADELRQKLDHLSTASQGVTVTNVTIEDENEDMVQLEGGDLPPAWQTTFTLSIQWNEG
jgi:hypothetical protein